MIYPLVKDLVQPLVRPLVNGFAEDEGIPTEGLVAAILGTLDSTNQNFLDTSGNANHLTLRTGRGVTGNGTTDWVSIPANATRLADVTSFSVGGWVTPGTLAAADTYFARWDTGANERVFAVRATGTTPTTLIVMTSADGAAESTWTSSANALANTTLAHIAITYNAGTLAVYLNGVAIAGAGTVAATLFATDIALTLFSSLNSGAVANAGSATLRDVRFYDVVLTPAEMLAWFTDPQSIPQASGLAGRWELKANNVASLTNVSALDSSGNGYHGVFTGCAGAVSLAGGPQSGLKSWSTRMRFDGTNDYVTGPSAFNPGTGNFTIEINWFGRFTSAQRVLFDARDADNDGLLIEMTAANVLSVSFNTVDSPTLTLLETVPQRISVTRAGTVGTITVVRLDTSATVDSDTVDLTGLNLAVAASWRVGATSFAAITGFMSGILWGLNLNGTSVPGTGNTVGDWITSATINGSPTNAMIPTLPNSTTDVLGGTATRIRKANCLSLFGDAEYGQFPMASPQSAFTWLAWAMPTANTGVNQAVINGKDAATDGPSLYANSSLASYRANVDSGEDIFTTAGIEDLWKYAGSVYSGTAVEAFVNGGGTASATAVVMTGSVITMRVGVNAFSLAGTFRGQLGLFLIYNRALTAEEILAIYTAQAPDFA